MSEHSEAPAHGGEHGAGHGETHGETHGHGTEQVWGDYNAQPLPPSPLPPVHPFFLGFFGLALAVLLSAIVVYSLTRAGARPPHEDSVRKTPHAPEH